MTPVEGFDTFVEATPIWWSHSLRGGNPAIGGATPGEPSLGGATPSVEATPSWGCLRLLPARFPVLSRGENVLYAVLARSAQLVLPRVLHQPCPNRIHQDIPGDGEEVLAFPKRAIIVATLPQSRAVRLTPRKTGSRVPTQNQAPEIRGIVQPLQNEVCMVRHDAVRNDCEAARPCPLQQLRSGPCAESEVVECALPVLGANSQEIGVKSDVVEVRQAAWAVRHADEWCNEQAR